jgi:protein-arginine kinase activator protein McsA
MEQQKMNIDLSKTEAIVCKECGSDVFESAFLIRKISGILVGSNTDQMIQIPIMICNNCGMKVEEFLPNNF